MITLLANTDNKIFELLPKFNYYLFVFSNTDCKIVSKLLSAEECDDSALFTINIDLPSGIYDLTIYGKDEANEELINSVTLKHEKVKVYNPENNCYDAPYLLDENRYIIADYDGTKILYNE